MAFVKLILKPCNLFLRGPEFFRFRLKRFFQIVHLFSLPGHDFIRHVAFLFQVTLEVRFLLSQFLRLLLHDFHVGIQDFDLSQRLSLVAAA